MKKYMTIVPMILIMAFFICIETMAQEPQPIPDRPWTAIIPDPDTYDWSSNDRPGYHFRGMEPMHQRFHDYIQRKRAEGDELSWAERATIRKLIAARRWPEAPRPNKFWAAYMRYLRSLPHDDLNTAQTLMLTELTRRGLVAMDSDPNQAVSRIREYLNSRPFEARNWFERIFGRAEDWMGPWLDYQLASHGFPLDAPGAADQFPLLAFGDYQVKYSMSGCTPRRRGVHPPYGPHPYDGTSSPGTAVTIRGRVRVGAQGADVIAFAMADKKTEQMEFKVTPQKEPSWYPFEATIAVPVGTKYVQLGVNMEWKDPSGGITQIRSLRAHAYLNPDTNTDETSSADAAWAKYVNETLARLGYSDTPLGKELKRMRSALAGTDADWKRYVNEEQRRLGYDSSPEAVAYYELNEAAQAGGEPWAAYVDRKEDEKAIRELEKIDAPAAEALNKKLAAELVDQGWESCRQDYDYEKGVPLLEQAVWDAGAGIRRETPVGPWLLE